ncbi:putative C-type lectin domain family 20 member A [Anguilla anguilla]|uniref:putative C-type lectin domain family 20 member A n=1 Tax=Anguilla anguilla TaxID=7936 RepID=UPI0015AA5C93|nr:putative C-type lectin domain family 20 member A [Anguilla anguilla]
MKADGDWENVTCTEERAFMCYNKGDGDHPLSYTLKKERRSWCEAQRFCRLHHTDLVSISSSTQNEEVKNKGDGEAPFWIGLIYTDWDWSDGACSTFRNGGGGKPEKGKDCGYLLKEEKKMGAQACSNDAVGICYKDEIHVIKSTKTWESALDYCNQNYEGFLRIESPQDQRRLEEELHKSNLSGPVWLGLRQSRLFGFWIWANGMNVGWSNWEGGSQPEQPLSHICGAIATSGPGKFKWSDQNCLSKSYFLCEGKKRGL